MNRTVIAALLAIGSPALAQTDYEPKPLTIPLDQAKVLEYLRSKAK